MELSQIERLHSFLNADLEYYLHHRRPLMPSDGEPALLAAALLRGAGLPPQHDGRRWRADTAIHGRSVHVASHVPPLLREVLAFSLLCHGS